jgi:hypothetical protein
VKVFQARKKSGESSPPLLNLLNYCVGSGRDVGVDACVYLTIGRAFCEPVTFARHCCPLPALLLQGLLHGRTERVAQP